MIEYNYSNVFKDHTASYKYSSKNIRFPALLKPMICLILFCPFVRMWNGSIFDILSINIYKTYFMKKILFISTVGSFRISFIKWYPLILYWPNRHEILQGQSFEGFKCKYRISYRWNNKCWNYGGLKKNENKILQSKKNMAIYHS